MRLSGITKYLKNTDKFSNIIDEINKNNSSISVQGLSGSGKSYFIQSIFESIEKSIVIVTNNDIEAKNLYEDLGLYSKNVYYFPIKEVVFYNVDAISGDLRWARLNVIKEILKNNKNIIITSMEALVSKYTPLDLYNEYTFEINVSKEIDIKNFTRKLLECGYEKVEVVEGKGQFSLKGGILDIFCPTEIYPYRIEFFADEVESIRIFNKDSQRSIDKINTINIFPAKEIIVNEKAKNLAIENITRELENIKNNKNISQETILKITSIVNYNIEKLKETNSFENIDSYISYFYEKENTLFDYLSDYLFIIDDSKKLEGKIDSIYYEFEQNYLSFLQRGDILHGQNNLIINKEDIIKNLEEKKVITLNTLDFKEDIFDSKKYDISQINLNGYNGQLDLLIDELISKKDDNIKVLILSGTKAKGERLVKFLEDKNIKAIYKDEVENINDGETIITFGNLINGFQYSDLNLCVISEKEIFGESKRKVLKRRDDKKGVSKIKSFGELKLGDYVVHVSHGIGVFKGINQIEVAGTTRDYLDIEYDKGDKLFIPVEKLDLIQKYIGTEGKIPKVNKLGSAEWQKAKAKARKSINEIADDLVKLYAMRASVKGFKFSEDTPWQRQFEDEFPYEETADQLSSVDEIKSDMQSDKVMDRLLCGDVGYGKTEVAVRAAFKAVMEKKQVAFLVPTTILAEQHYKNLVKRFSSFDVKIDMISRFRTTKQQRLTIEDAKEGKIDILIGTHRIVSKDIGFKDLGLLIIDEEQRFGVAQKEKIKNLKKNVDVLTLSATPIPRTLHMSLSGVRDISVIETPPENRYPIQTYVVEQNDQLVRDAILREISRDGQVYFVYNRIESIESMASYLKELIPECEVGIMHGRMSEKELETQMISFMKKEFNILVCTTIIETGIDMQNVNTIIVHDADKMGLSQLYQLRGRVGRSNRIAYAYFVYLKDKVLSEIAEKRLKALKDFTELGSGFKIAMRDLEIRGAGNIMGSSQHGHMSSIGYDLYCRMLEDTVNSIKGDIEKENIETSIDIKISGYIPKDYINDEVQKIEIYKRIASIKGLSDYKEIEDELVDRFSYIPETVYNLMDISYIKCSANYLSIEEVKEVKNELIFKFSKHFKEISKIYSILMKNYKENVVLYFSETYSFSLKLNKIKNDNILNFYKEVLDTVIKGL